MHIEHWWLMRLRLGLRTAHTGAGRGGGTPLDPDGWAIPMDGGGAPLWEHLWWRHGLVPNRELIQLGMVRWIDVYAGRDCDGTTGWKEWGFFSGYYDDADKTKSANELRRTRTSYEQTMAVVAADADAAEWLQAYAAAQPLCSYPPREHPEVQRRLDVMDAYAEKKRPPELEDVCESGRRTAQGEAELEYDDLSPNN